MWNFRGKEIPYFRTILPRRRCPYRQVDGGKCILQIRGARPFFSDKYDITKHKNYRLLADENEKNRYKVEKELNPQYTPKSEEEVEVIHVELSE